MNEEINNNSCNCTKGLHPCSKHRYTTNDKLPEKEYECECSFKFTVVGTDYDQELPDYAECQECKRRAVGKMTNKLIYGDCLEKMKDIPDKSISLCLTDPPYDMDSMYLYEGLLSECERILVDSGNLIFLCGHHQLFHILNIETELRKWWIGWLNHNRSNRIFGKNVIVKGKPWLWYNNKIREKTSKVPMDTITLDKKDWSKKFHKLEQPVKFFEHFVEFLSVEKEMILDPFMGSGSTGVACKKLNRNFIGIEIDKKYYEIAKKRLKP